MKSWLGKRHESAQQWIFCMLFAGLEKNKPPLKKNTNFPSPFDMLMNRRDPLVRKKCRELFGADWWNTDDNKKRQRQDDAIAVLQKESNPGKARKKTFSCKGKAGLTDADKDTLRAQIAASLPKASIVSIDAIYNTAMDQCYEALKASIDPSTEQRWLFHGTTQDACKNIITKGFNRSYCGKNATVFGRGVYFAKHLLYSSSKTYSPPDESGVQTIIAARVLVGKTILGDTNMVEPPGNATTSVNNMADPSVFVVYKDSQAIPEFVIRLNLS